MRGTGSAGVHQIAGWVAVIPLKRLAAAKSRLSGAVDAARHQELAMAMASDTVVAVRACAEVTDVLLVTDEPAFASVAVSLGAVVVPDGPTTGLNAAARFGADTCAGLDRRRAVLTGDLPALRPSELADALRAAVGGTERHFVPDAAGAGTVLLTAAAGVALDPRFGVGSALRHSRSGALPLLRDWPGLRHDVDTAADLRAALALGVGPHTHELARELRMVDTVSPPTPSRHREQCRAG